MVIEESPGKAPVQNSEGAPLKLGLGGAFRAGLT